MDFTTGFGFGKQISIPDDAQVVWVNDMFVEDYVGGAELTSEALIKTSPFNVFKLHSKDVTMDLLQKGQNLFWVFGNFSQLNLDLIPAILVNMKYAMVEYDYKFCKYRSPEKHEIAEGNPCNCVDAQHGQLVAALFRGAKHLWWMSEKQMDIYHEKYSFLKTEVKNTVLSSVFDDETLASIKLLREKAQNEERNGWIILGSNSWIKGFEDAKQYCEDNNLDYEILWNKPYGEVLEKLSKAEGHVYLPKGNDTCPRMVIEAKLLGCKLVLNDFVQHKDEDWFNPIADETDDETTQIEQYLYAAREWFWNGVKSDIEYVPTISGYTTTRNCISQNYPYEACIKSMLDFCDEVVVMDGGSDDGTYAHLEKWAGEEAKLKIYRADMQWDTKRFAVFDGMLKSMAREACTMDYCWQCVTPETMISTIDGEKRIDRISPGDLVLTHKGRYKKVKTVYSRPIKDEKLFSIKKMGDNRRLNITDNHPIYVWNKKDKKYYWKTVEEIDLCTDGFTYPKLKEKSDIESLKIPVSCGKNSFELLDVDLSYYFGLFIGLYLGDGSLSIDKGRHQYIRWSFNIEQMNVVNSLRECIDYIFGDNIKLCVYERKEKSELICQIGNHKLSEWLFQNFGTGSHDKFIKLKNIYGFNSNFISGLLKGYYLSDGSNDHKQIKIDSVNNKLLAQIKILSTKLGLFGTLSEYKTKKTGFVATKEEMYRISFSGKQMNKARILMEDFSKKKPLMMGQKQFFKEENEFGNFIFSAFSEINELVYSGYLYNIEVEDDNSYVANGVTVHNCDSDEVVHENDMERIKKIVSNFPSNVDILALPVVEFWGGPEKVRMDINPWKWRLSRNKKHIGHGVPKDLRVYEEDGGYYAKMGTDGCDYIHRETFEPIQFANFYTADIEMLRRQGLSQDLARENYERWFNLATNEIPGVFHFSWWDIERKIKTYKNYWQKHWESLFNIKMEDTTENNMFFDKPWSEVSDEEISEKAAELKEKTGGWIFHSKWQGQQVPCIKIARELPKYIKEWIGGE